MDGEMDPSDHDDDYKIIFLFLFKTELLTIRQFLPSVQISTIKFIVEKD